MALTIVKWACTRKEFLDLKIDVLHNWGACMKMGVSMKKKKKKSWCSPPFGALKFHVDGAARGKQGLASIRGILRNYKGNVLNMFSKHVGIKDSNEAEVLAILAPQTCCSSHRQSLHVESDSFNAISWANSF